MSRTASSQRAGACERVETAERVVVCGGGAAGMAAALAAARAGADVCLLEAAPRLGGTVAHALIHTLGGLFDSAGSFLIDGLPRELAERLGAADRTVQQRRIGRAWVLNVDPKLYQAVVQGWIEQEPRIEVCCQTRVTGLARQGNRITEIEARGSAGAISRRTRAVVDATGGAAVVRLLDPALVHNDDRAAAGGLIFRLRGVAHDALTSLNGVRIVRALRAAAAEGRLPVDCRHAWLDRGVYEDEAFVKLFVPLARGWSADREAVQQASMRTHDAVLQFLKSQPGFAEARLTQTGELGVRDGGRVRGEYCLTAADVRQGRKFADAACRCAWPIEYWDPAEGIHLEYLPDGACYDIPLRALRVQGYGNVFVAGKCLSADRLAQASARVAGTCWAMGEAVGIAAAQGVESPCH